MTVKVYLSEVSAFWTFERQEAVLAAVLPGAKVFRDVLDRRVRRAQSPASLLDREKLLRSTSSPDLDETVYVASLAVLAWSLDDLRTVLAVLARRGARLVSMDDGDPEDVPAAWQAASAKARRAAGGETGGNVTRRNMEAAYAPRVKAIAQRWGDSAYSTAELLREAGVSRNTAIKYIGTTRGDAIRKEAARLKRKAKKENKDA